MDRQASSEPRTEAPAEVATPTGPPSIHEDIDTWAEELARLGRSATYQRQGPIQLREMVACYGWTRPFDAKAPQIREWVMLRPGGGHTQNNRFAVASAFFKFARKMCRRPGDPPWKNPCRNIDRSPRFKGEGSREFDADQQNRIIAAANGHWKTACILFATTLLRRGAVFRGIRCGWYDAKNRELKLPPGVLTNKKRQVIQLNADACAALDAATKGRNPREQVIPVRFDHLIWLALLKRANVPHEDERGRIAGTHSFRKGGGLRLAEAGVHPKVAQGIMGHSDIRLTMELYTPLDARHEREAVKVLGTRNGVIHRPAEKTESDLTKPSGGADTGNVTLTQTSPQHGRTNLPAAEVCERHNSDTRRVGLLGRDRNPVGDPSTNGVEAPENSPTRTRTLWGGSPSDAPAGFQGHGNDLRLEALAELARAIRGLVPGRGE